MTAGMGLAEPASGVTLHPTFAIALRVVLIKT
jgi:hypothetical protein